MARFVCEAELHHFPLFSIQRMCENFDPDFNELVQLYHSIALMSSAYYQEEVDPAPKSWMEQFGNGKLRRLVLPDASQLIMQFSQQSMEDLNNIRNLVQQNLEAAAKISTKEQIQFLGMLYPRYGIYVFESVLEAMMEDGNTNERQAWIQTLKLLEEKCRKVDPDDVDQNDQNEEVLQAAITIAGNPEPCSDFFPGLIKTC